jgi:hypothetical protein
MNGVDVDDVVSSASIVKNIFLLLICEHGIGEAFTVNTMTGNGGSFSEGSLA